MDAVTPPAAPARSADLAGQIREAQRQLAESVVRAGLQRDPYRHALEAMAVVIGTFPVFVERLEATRQPFKDEDLRRLEQVAAKGAAGRAVDIVWARNWRTALMALCLLLATAVGAAGFGYCVRGAVPHLVGVRAGAEQCRDQSDGARLCWIPVWERLPPTK
jgi:hypothetical protein